MTIAPSSVAEVVIWAGSNDGAVQLTRDGGATWQNVTPPAVSDWSAVPLIEASHFDAGTAYVVVNRNPLDDLRPHILQTHDFGRTWQETVSGIGTPILFVWCVKIRCAGICSMQEPNRVRTSLSTAAATGSVCV